MIHLASAALRIPKVGRAGANPFATLGGILVDIRSGAFGDNSALQIGDFQAAAGKNAVLTLTNTPVSGWYSKALGRPISSMSTSLA